MVCDDSEHFVGRFNEAIWSKSDSKLPIGKEAAPKFYVAFQMAQGLQTTNAN